MPSRSPSIRHSARKKLGFDQGSATAFGEVVRAARVHAGISQEALAYMSDIERSYMSMLERGKSQPTLFVILKVSDALGYEAWQLLALVQDRLIAGSRHAGAKRRAAGA